ncbi:MAG TPA: cation diffusion facilitator family transporter [Thermoleophilia bacterium]|nr:cation diffusion facilitator family transporter [Thermoleophilia bacterium]
MSPEHLSLEEANRVKARAAYVSIVSNSVLITFKLAVGIISGSVGIISEALHSGSDLLAAIIAFFSVRQAAKPADLRHRYGHEKVENVSGVIEGALILGAAVVIIYEATQKLIHGLHIDHLWLAIGVMLVSAAVNIGVSRYLYPIARRTESAALEADAAHLLTDVYTSLGVAAGLALVKLTGETFFDPLLAIAIAAIIIRTAIGLMSQSTRVLLDEALPDDELAVIRDTVAEHRGELIIGYHRLRARRAGSKRHIDLHVTVEDDMGIVDAHDAAMHISEDIRRRLPNAEVLVHVEPRSHDREDDS